jgi:uncharacterized membrane protein YphA (DoxX/SURF4 family)
MPAIAATSMLSRLKTVGLWVLKIALAALFALTAWAKLYGVPPMVEIFEKVGLGQWFRYFTGRRLLAVMAWHRRIRGAAADRRLYRRFFCPTLHPP